MQPHLSEEKAGGQGRGRARGSGLRLGGGCEPSRRTRKLRANAGVTASGCRVATWLTWILFPSGLFYSVSLNCTINTFIMTTGAAQRPTEEGPSLPLASTPSATAAGPPPARALPQLAQHPHTKAAVSPHSPRARMHGPAIPCFLHSVRPGQPTRRYVEVTMLFHQGYITVYNINMPLLGNI